MIRVGFVPLYNNHFPSSRYRVHQFLEPLSRQGFQCVCLEAPEKNFRKRLTYLPPLFKLAKTSDLLVVQKRTFPSWVLQLLARMNPRIIFDLDDAIYLQPERRSQVLRLIKMADWVIAGNRTLADYVRSYNPHVWIIPTVVDTRLYAPPEGPRHAGDERIVLGWIGINPNRGDLFPLKPVFDGLADRYQGRVVLRIVSSSPLVMETRLAVEFVPWTIEAGQHSLQQFDIGLMPLADNEWNRGKCAFKLIQYLASGAPAVASPVGANTEVLLEGETGHLANTPSEWIAALSDLIENEPTRFRLGQRGRQHVIDHYSIEAVLPLLVEVIHTVAGEARRRDS